MNFIKYVLVSCISFSALFINAAAVSPANGYQNCSAYGVDCPPASYLVVDKLIRDPRAKGDVYVDHLSWNDYRFSPGEDIIFKILVKNTGPDAITNVDTEDILPNVVNLLNSDGTLDEETREFSRHFDRIESGETEAWYIRVRVKSAQHLTKNIQCAHPDAINRITTTADDMPEARDGSSFCVEKAVLGAIEQPETGASLYTSVLAGIVALSGVAVIGRKFIAS